MKVWKLVSGIITVVLSLIVFLQSCTVMVGESISRGHGFAGTYGWLMSILMLAGGIVSIASNRSNGSGGDIAVVVIFLSACLCGGIGLLGGTYKDLILWLAWCLVMLVMAIIKLVLPASAKPRTPVPPQDPSEPQSPPAPTV